jgi:ATP-binding cassette subfamily B protein
MDTEEEPADAPGCISAKYIKGKIEFENVYFSYSSEKEVLNGISLHINEGEKVALIGTTGAGKTTIMNLIPRFFDISSGSIKIDGIEIDKYKKTELRSQLAIVLQDTHLFTGTIYENIRFGRLDATDKEVEYAVRLSSADLFIKKLPDGYNTVLENDGSNLSQGQRQLLNIARAAVSNPSILLLDEATSNIDSRSEMLIQKGLEQLMKGRTTFIIAHRFSTIRNVDTIYVIEKGQIVEKGNHRELMRLKGYYYRLYRNQTQL